MKQYLQTVIFSSDCTFPVYADVDVLVAGGGPAGVAAAETAARHGLKTLLLERLGFLGGAAVAGYSGTICGMFYSSEDPLKDGPQQCVFGWPNRFYQNMKARGGVTRPQRYGKTFLITHDPQMWKETAEDMLADAGSKILYHVTVTGVIRDGDELKGLVIDTKNGLAQIRAKVIIDATGDGDVIYRSGYAYTMGDNGAIQNPTMIFRLGGVDVPRFLEYWGNDSISPDKVTDKIIKAAKAGACLPRAKVWVYDTTRPNELFMNVTLITGRDGRALNVCDPDDHTEAEQQGRKQVRAYGEIYKREIAGGENSFINDLSAEIGVRQTRSIKGIDQLKNEDVAQARKRPDGIARCPWPIELHNGERPYLFWLINDYYEVPYGALVPEKGDNLIVAGRNLCAEHQALASCRVTAQCFQYGQAAAIAAGIAIREGVRLRDIPGEKVRLEMNEDGAGLD